MACARLNLFILSFGSCLPFTGEPLHPGIPSQMSQHRKPLVEPQYLISGLLVPEKYTRSHHVKLGYSTFSPFSISFVYSFFLVFILILLFFFFISLFLFRRIFSNPFFPLFSRNFLFLLFLSSYFLNYPRGFFHPLFFSFFGDILIVSSLCSTSPLSWIRLASFSVITTTPLFTLLSTPFDQPFRHVLVS